MANITVHPEHVVRAPWKDTFVPDTDIYTFMFRRETVGNMPPNRNPDRLAFIDGPSGKKITFRQLKERIELLSRALPAAMNIRRGDTICFYLPNHIDYPTALWAALRLGVIPSCANPIYTAHELVHQLNLSSAKFILTHPAFLKSATAAARMVGIPDSRIFLIEKGNSSGYQTLPELVQIGKSAPEIEPLRLAPGEARNKVALLNFSSGTSGLPKGVLISHRNVIANVCQMSAQESGFDFEGQVSNGCLPFFHIYGLVVLMHYQLSSGATVVVQPTFAPDVFVQDIHKYKITSLFVVPPIMQVLLHRITPEKMNFNPPLQSICCAAAPLPQEIVPKLQKLWPTCLMRQGWGMTETATAVAFMPHGSPLKGYSHTCGPIIPNAQAVIIDIERGTSIAPGKGQGELWVRGPSITLGYINNLKETKEMFNIGGEGWMRSGDEAEFERGKVMVDGVIREEWLLCIRDRLKELIKVSGNQVAPAELENVLAAHPAIADQAVVGKPDDRRGEVPWAFIVKKKEVSKEEIMEWVKERTSKYKHLGGVTFVDQIVKNPSGKILKRMYREMFKRERESAPVKAKL